MTASNSISIFRDDTVVYRVPKCTAKQGEEVTWDPGDFNVTIWFPCTGVFSGSILEIAKGQTGSMTVLADAPLGEFQYAVFCHDTCEFFEGNSHPVMMIERGP